MLKRMRGSANGRQLRGERGQVLIFFVLIVTAFFVAAAIAIDYGLWLSEVRGIARASDMGALAATQDMPADPSCGGGVPGCDFQSLAACNAPAEAPPPTLPPPGWWAKGDACKSAFDWAKRNGYEDGVDGTEVKVTFLCGNDLQAVVRTTINGPTTSPYPQRVCHNGACNAPAPPGIPNSGTDCVAPYLTNCPDEAGEKGCDAIRVEIKKPGVRIVSSLFGGAGFDVGYTSYGSVTFKLTPTDSAIVMDRSGSMKDPPCSGANNQPGCKIREAKLAANNFVDQLINGSGITKIGYAPYTGCYNPPLNDAQCVPAPAPGNILTAANCNNPGASQVACLNAIPTTAHNLINATQPNGSTNICLGLREGQKVLDGPGNQSIGAAADPSTKRFAVVLTDGDNEYDVATAAGLDAFCAPTGATACAPANSCGGCNQPRTPINRNLDVKTLQRATVMKANTEVFTIQVYDSSCVPPNVTYLPNECNNQVGNLDSLKTSSARLMQCVASSTPNTNDHYFKTNDATTLVNIFTTVAYEIASRGLTVQGPQ